MGLCIPQICNNTEL
jgi:hypothetical protein